MKRKLLPTMLFLLVFVFIAALPATAEEIKLNLNGQPVTFADIYMENGVTMISLNSFAQVSGVNLTSSGSNALSLTKNNTTLILTLGKKDAVLNGKTIQLPAPPVKSGDETFVSLRSLADIFGYEVKWNKEKATVELAINETKDGMTLQDLLVKASQAAQNINTYALNGNYIMNITIINDDEQQMSINGLTTTMTGQIQQKPLQAYLIQRVEFPEFLGLEDSQLVTETYMTEDKMYIKSQDGSWTVQEMPLPAEFWQQQQNLQSNPLEITTQMTELGGTLSFSDNTTIDGKDYYVVNATYDMDDLRSVYSQVFQQVMSSMPYQTEDYEKIKQVIEKFLENAKMNYLYKSFINKETFLSEKGQLDMKLDFTIDLSEIAQEELSSEIPQKLQMKIDLQGQFNIIDAGKPFTAPDVKDAVPLSN